MVQVEDMEAWVKVFNDLLETVKPTLQQRGKVRGWTLEKKLVRAVLNTTRILLGGLLIKSGFSLASFRVNFTASKKTINPIPPMWT